jgi:hypothetical protein
MFLKETSVKLYSITSQKIVLILFHKAFVPFYIYPIEKTRLKLNLESNV